MEQQHMFEDGSDLPLFSGTCQKADLAEFKPADVVPQTTYAHCKACMDTGRIGNKYCLCKAGQDALADLRRAQDQALFAHAIHAIDARGEVVLQDDAPGLHRLIYRGDLIPLGRHRYTVHLTTVDLPVPTVTPDQLYREILKDHDTYTASSTTGTNLAWYDDLGNGVAVAALDLYASGRIDLFAGKRGERRVRLPVVDQPQPESKI